MKKNLLLNTDNIENGSHQSSLELYTPIDQAHTKETLKEKLLRLKEYREQGIPNIELRTNEGLENVEKNLLDSSKIKVKQYFEFKAFSRPAIIPEFYYYQDLGNNNHYVLLKHAPDGYNVKYTHLNSDINQPLLHKILSQPDLFGGIKEKIETILEEFKTYEEQQKLSSVIKPIKINNDTKNNNKI
jgi:hypothetical protein